MVRDWFFHVLMAWLCIFMMVIASSNKANAQPDKAFPIADLWGNVYPVACRQDLTWLIPTLQIVRKDLGYNSGGKGIGYWWHDFGTRRTTISLDTSLSDRDRYNNALHHELCHELMYRTTGNPYWHKE